MARPYRNDDADWQAVRDLLVRTHGAVGRGWTWDIRRWDGLRFHDEVPVLPRDLRARARRPARAGGGRRDLGPA